MKVTNKGQVTIPSPMCKKHGLFARAEVACVDQPNGVLVTRAAKLTAWQTRNFHFNAWRRGQRKYQRVACHDSRRDMILVLSDQSISP